MRNGKIAKLPLEVRNELNLRLENGEDGPKLLRWLNGLPVVQETLQARFGGVPVTKQNLSEWRRGGFRDWQRHTEWVHQACDLHQYTEDMEEVVDTPLVAGDLAALLAIRYAALLNTWDGEPDPKFQQNLRLLRGLGQDIALLQRTLHRVSRQKAEEEQHEEEDRLQHKARMRELAVSPILAALERNSLEGMFGMFVDKTAAERLAELVTAMQFDLQPPKKAPEVPTGPAPSDTPEVAPPSAVGPAEEDDHIPLPVKEVAPPSAVGPPEQDSRTQSHLVAPKNRFDRSLTPKTRQPGKPLETRPANAS